MPRVSNRLSDYLIKQLQIDDGYPKWPYKFYRYKEISFWDFWLLKTVSFLLLYKIKLIILLPENYITLWYLITAVRRKTNNVSLFYWNISPVLVGQNA